MQTIVIMLLCVHSTLIHSLNIVKNLKIFRVTPQYILYDKVKVDYCYAKLEFPPRPNNIARRVSLYTSIITEFHFCNRFVLTSKIGYFSKIDTNMPIQESDMCAMCSSVHFPG